MMQMIKTKTKQTEKHTDSGFILQPQQFRNIHTIDGRRSGRISPVGDGASITSARNTAQEIAKIDAHKIEFRVVARAGFAAFDMFDLDTKTWVVVANVDHGISGSVDTREPHSFHLPQLIAGRIKNVQRRTRATRLSVAVCFESPSNRLRLLNSARTRSRLSRGDHAIEFCQWRWW